MTSVVDVLKHQVEGWRSLGRVPLLDEFILRNGKPYIAAKYKGARGVPKDCFKNTYDLLAARPHLLYVEGYATRPTLGILIHHAWLADPKSQEVIDPTWDYPEHCDYFGVPFTHAEVLIEVLRNGTYCLLDTGMGINDKFVFERDPALKALFEEKHPCPRKPTKSPAKPSRKSGASSKSSKPTSKPNSSARSPSR